MPVRAALRGAGLLLLLSASHLSAPAQQPPISPSDPSPNASLDTSDHKAVEDRADLYMVRKYYPEAIGLYQKLIAMDPKNPLYYDKLGIAYHQLQKFEDAKKSYRKAIQLRPQYPEALNNLAAVQYAQKDYRAAIVTYLNALKLSPGDAVIYSNLGTAYFAFKKFDYAMAAYRYALLRDPEIFQRSGRTGSIVQQRQVENMGAFNFYLAKTYAGMSDVEQTLLYLTKAFEAGFPDMRKQLNDPAFKFLAKEPRFLDLIAQLDGTQSQSPGSAAAAPRTP